MLRTFALLVTLLPLCHCLFGIGRLQSVAVKGKLVCNNIPASKVKVKLYEKELSTRKWMKHERTSTGKFRLSGSKREITTIDPKVNIYHKCGYSGVSRCYVEALVHLMLLWVM
ncbi:Transthyretin-like family protein [Cooperia oncophora]